MAISHQYTILCDDVRPEINGKLIFIGVYVPDIVVAHRKLGFGLQDSRVFDRRVVVNRAYLFRKNFRQTVLARLQFALFVLALVVHRLLNREWRGARGLLEGVAAVWFRR